jgi:hypothetical protein
MDLCLTSALNIIDISILNADNNGYFQTISGHFRTGVLTMLGDGAHATIYNLMHGLCGSG